MMRFRSDGMGNNSHPQGLGKEKAPRQWAVRLTIGATPSDHAPALDNPHEEDDDRHSQQDVNQPAESETADQTQGPEDEEYDRDCLEHCGSPVIEISA